MKIKFHKAYLKAYDRLPSKIQQKAEERIRLFCESPYASQLHNHPLKGSMRGFRAFSVTGDYRIIYRTKEKEAVFLDIGRHSRVYH